MQNENKTVNQSQLVEIPITDVLNMFLFLGILTGFIDAIYIEIVGLRRTS
jgi:hypothetical protein